MLDEKVRLQKAIAILTGISRRQAERLIEAKQVKVNGQVAESGQKVCLGKDRIEVEGQQLSSKVGQKEYLLIYKPQKVITSRKDELGRKTIMELLPKKYQHLFPVGRLDYDSEGLVLLTNDGDLAYRLTHPKFKVVKVYQVLSDRSLTHAACGRLKQGMRLKGRQVKPVSLRRLKNGWIEVGITSGQKHVVRKLFKHVGYEVVRLKRVKFGPFSLQDLGPGDYRKTRYKKTLKLKKV